jgi:hypothetical protein
MTAVAVGLSEPNESPQRVRSALAARIPAGPSHRRVEVFEEPKSMTSYTRGSPEPTATRRVRTRTDVAELPPQLEPMIAETGRPAEVTLPEKSHCHGTLGTAVDFVASPEQAMARAKSEHKLVFVLHVSGNFEDPGFT